MAITSYISYAEIRAVLGVSATELSDTVLAQSQWETLLILDLEDVNVGIPALFTTVAAITTSPSKTATQQRFYDLTKLFAGYAVARSLLISLPFFSVQQLTDGKAEFQRQAGLFEEVKTGVEALYRAIREKLTASYVVLAPSETAFAITEFDYMTSTGVAVNPMTSTVV